MRLIPERLRRRRRRDPEGAMSLVEHLEELRYRLVVSIAGVVIGAVVGWFLFDGLVDLLQEPYCDYLEKIPDSQRVSEECTFFFSGALEPALIKFKLVGVMGLFFALPLVLYQLWAFIVPGLTKRERRMAIPFVLSSVLLFALGALFAYVTLPRALQFLLGFAGTTNFTALLTGERFFTFVVLVALSFGLAFELPIALMFLNAAGVISTTQLRRWRRGAILFIAIFAAIITPSSDPYTMLAMSVPMWLFYELAIIVGRIRKR
jgi:sec-independent protein translocase protein TatC